MQESVEEAGDRSRTILFGFREQVSPEVGIVVGERLTLPAKPLTAPTVMLESPSLPDKKAIVVGPAVRVKS